MRYFDFSPVGEDGIDIVVSRDFENNSRLIVQDFGWSGRFGAYDLILPILNHIPDFKTSSDICLAVDS